eukprot:361100-Chlamydomonas_euryale.AAC.32
MVMWPVQSPPTAKALLDATAARAAHLGIFPRSPCMRALGRMHACHMCFATPASLRRTFTHTSTSDAPSRRRAEPLACTISPNCTSTGLRARQHQAKCAQLRACRHDIHVPAAPHTCQRLVTVQGPAPLSCLSRRLRFESMPAPSMPDAILCPLA